LNELARKALADGKLAVGTPGGHAARIDGLSVPPFVSSDFALSRDFRLGSALSGDLQLFQARQLPEHFPGLDHLAIVDGPGTNLQRLRCRPGLWRPGLTGGFVTT
jgi:hypothetical protein